MLIFFVGYIASGKRKWGQRLAQELQYNFVDTRELMEQKTGERYEKLLSNKEKFIIAEQAVLQDIIKLENTIVAVGEMMPCRNDNMEILKNAGLTFFLRAGLGCIMMKIPKKRHKIPMIQNIDPDFLPDFLQSEIERRKPYYKQAHINYLERDLRKPKLMEIVHKAIQISENSNKE